MFSAGRSYFKSPVSLSFVDDKKDDTGTLIDGPYLQIIGKFAIAGFSVFC